MNSISEKINVYREFLTLRETESRHGLLAPYKWHKLPSPIPAQWIIYSQMLEEHSRDLSNSINEYLRYIVDLAAWNSVIEGKNEDETFYILLEFINPVATLAINMPYIIRSRFIYSISHLCHQANRVKLKKWIDDLPPDAEIYFEVADRHAVHWESYKNLKKALEKIDNKDYRVKTNEFRNKYIHRYSQYIEMGLSGFISRNVDVDGKVSYGLGSRPPLKIARLLPNLKEQHSSCLDSLEKYKFLIEEQISTIW
jgi:hypothetical protein